MTALRERQSMASRQSADKRAIALAPLSESFMPLAS